VLNNSDLWPSVRSFTTVINVRDVRDLRLSALLGQQIAGYTPLLAGYGAVDPEFRHASRRSCWAGRLFKTWWTARILVFVRCLSWRLLAPGIWPISIPKIRFLSIALPGLYRGIGSGLHFYSDDDAQPRVRFRKEEMGTASGLFQHGADDRRQYRHRDPGGDAQ